MDTINYLNIGLLILGVFSIVIFSSINLYNNSNMSANQIKMESDSKPVVTTEEKGLGPKMPGTQQVLNEGLGPKMPKPDKKAK